MYYFITIILTSLLTYLIFNKFNKNKDCSIPMYDNEKDLINKTIYLVNEKKLKIEDHKVIAVHKVFNESVVNVYIYLKTSFGYSNILNFCEDLDFYRFINRNIHDRILERNGIIITYENYQKKGNTFLGTRFPIPKYHKDNVYKTFYTNHNDAKNYLSDLLRKKGEQILDESNEILK